MNITGNPSLRDLADFITSQIDAPSSSGDGSSAGFAPASADGGSGTQDLSQQFGQKPQEQSGQLDGILAGMSKDDLEQLKFALSNSSKATAAFTVAIGALLFVISPSLLTVTIVSGGLTLMSIGLDYLASQIDKYLGKS